MAGLRVIAGGVPKAARSPVGHLWSCGQCKRDIGVATAALILELIGARWHRGRIVGGRKRWLCRACMMRGITTPAA